MKKFVLTLTIMLFTVGAFASNSVLEKADMIINKEVVFQQEDDEGICSVTVITTTNHGDYTVTTTSTTYFECDDS